IGKPSGLITRSADQLRTTCKAARRAKVRTARSAMTAITDWPTPVSKPQSSWLSPIMMPPSSVWRRLAIGGCRKAPVFLVTMILPLPGRGGGEGGGGGGGVFLGGGCPARGGGGAPPQTRRGEKAAHCPDRQRAPPGR